MFGALLLTIAIQFGQVETAEAKPPSTEDIAKAIKELGHDSFTVREEATKFLWRAGKPAEAALEQVVKSNDREVAFRAKFILDRFRAGIYPDTPPDVVQLINQYHAGNLNVKQSVLQQLQQKKLYRTMLSLVRSESDTNVQKSLAQSFLRNTSDVVQHLLVEQDFDRAEELIEWGAEFDSYGTQQRNYAAFLLLRGAADKKIAALKLRDENESNTARLLAHLFKVKGDYANAKVYAARAGDNRLMADLYLRVDDWASLAQADMIPGDEGVENLGFSAAIHGLAGNEKEFKEAIAGIQQLAIDKPDSVWMCAEALMISDQWQAAIDLQKEKTAVNSFRMLCEQARHAEAFALIGINNPQTESADWYAKQAEKLAAASPEMSRHFGLGLYVARTLQQLNEEAEAKKLFSKLKDDAVDDNGARMRALIVAELSVGLKEQAYKHAAIALVDPKQKGTILTTLFKSQATTADCWLPHFVLSTSKDEETTALQKLAELLNPTGDRLELAVLEMLIASCLQHAPGDEKEQVTWMKAISDVCTIHDQPELARLYIEKELASQPSADAMMRIADTFVKQEKWQEAADWYQKAWQLDQKTIAALYLQGHALQKAGHIDEGSKLVEQAELLPLADIVKRGELASGLSARGMLEQAIRQWELMLEFGPFDSFEGSEAWAVRDAARYLGFHLAEKDRLRSASLERRRLFYLLKTNSSFIDIEYYARVMHRVHELRTLGLLEQGKIAEATQEALQAHAARPDRVDSAITFVHEFEAAGEKETADKIFAMTLEGHEATCRSFPNSAHHHNNLAWLAARCERRLDDALAHAKRAVELKPDFPAYVDTLAEAYYQLGDREQAIETARRALELTPKDEHLVKQLARFQDEKK